MEYTVSDLLFAHWLKRKRELLAEPTVIYGRGFIAGEPGNNWRPCHFSVDPKGGKGEVHFTHDPRGSQAWDAVRAFYDKGEKVVGVWRGNKHPDPLPLHRVIDDQLDALRSKRNPNLPLFF